MLANTNKGFSGSIKAVERTASQPTGSLGDGGVRGGWLAVAHFLRSAANGVSQSKALKE
jgi:hypothetical protein